MLLHLLIVGVGGVVCQRCSETIILDNAEKLITKECIFPMHLDCALPIFNEFHLLTYIYIYIYIYIYK
jgi:hypothetical protein